MVMIRPAAVVIWNWWSANAPTLSTARSVKLNEPTTVGVPLSVPPLGSSLIPSGSAPPVNDHVYGGVPPAARSCCEYGCSNQGVGQRVRLYTHGSIDSDGICLRGACAGNVRRLKGEGIGPRSRAVPRIAPAESSVRPGGSEPELRDHGYGGEPPVAVSVCA